MTKNGDTQMKTSDQEASSGFQDEWMEIPELKSWLKPVPGNTSLALCTICNINLPAKLNILKAHCKNNMHLKFIKAQENNARAQERVKTRPVRQAVKQRQQQQQEAAQQKKQQKEQQKLQRQRRAAAAARNAAIRSRNAQQTRNPVLRPQQGTKDSIQAVANNVMAMVAKNAPDKMPLISPDMIYEQIMETIKFENADLNKKLDETQLLQLWASRVPDERPELPNPLPVFGIQGATAPEIAAQEMAVSRCQNQLKELQLARQQDQNSSS